MNKLMNIQRMRLAINMPILYKVLYSLARRRLFYLSLAISSQAGLQTGFCNITEEVFA